MLRDLMLTLADLFGLRPRRQTIVIDRLPPYFLR
jgi:hypothetical protein